MGSIREKLRIRKVDTVSGLDYHRSIWVEEEELGKDKIIVHKEKKIKFKVPQEIDGKTVLRLKGFGKTRGNLVGNLLLHVWMNKGEDVKGALWLSESSARNGTSKNLLFMGERIQVLVPKGSSGGSIIKVKGLGEKAWFRWSTPFHSRKRGDLLVKLRAYPDYVKPLYRSPDSLDTDALALEGWVYRKKDEIVAKLGKSILNVQPVKADTIADIFNEYGWKAVFNYLVNHLNLAHLSIMLETSDPDSKPGKCQGNVSRSGTVVSRSYRVTINEAFIDNPFSVTAISAHELSHVAYHENFRGMMPANQGST